MPKNRNIGKKFKDNIVLYDSTTKKDQDLNYVPADKHCYLCRINFSTEKEHFDHIPVHLEKSADLENSKDSKQQFSVIFENTKYVTKVSFFCKMLNDKKVTLKRIILIHPMVRMITLCDEDKLQKSHKGTIEVFSEKENFLYHNQSYKIVIAFQYEAQKEYEYLEEHILKLGNIPNTKEVDLNPKVASERIPMEEGLKGYRLNAFFPVDELYTVVKYNFSEGSHMNTTHWKLIQKYSEFGKTDTTKNNYFDKMRFMLHMEECFITNQIKKYNQDNVTFLLKEGRLFYPVDDNMAQSQYLDKWVSVLLTAMSNNKLYDARFIRIKNKFLELEIDLTGFNHRTKYKMEFFLNRYGFQVEHNALSLMERTKWCSYLFPNKAISCHNYLNFSYNWYNKDIENNEQQKLAVMNIVFGTYSPCPYIIFGPPGTGKTLTIVEAVLQVLKNKTNSNILITAMSNSACDEIAKRLLKYLSIEHILRMYSERAADECPEELLDISNINRLTDKQFYPRLNCIEKFKIVITTMITSARLALASISAKHFTHVFIDECGSSRESATLAAVAGIVTTSQGVLADVILAGDPHQLGPIIYSLKANDIGLGTSFLERLMKMDVYSKNPNTKQYNANYITKLVKNYRSHASIIKISNELFYEKEILVAGNKKTIEAAIGWTYLHNPKFPIIFHHVKGDTIKDEFTSSCYNKGEIRVIMRYLKELRERPIGELVGFHNIGVISPYRKQVSIIQDECHKKMMEIDIGTIENFQGREKPIILISTVRSEPSKLGFLDNPKRLNVALTRAQALLIVVGDAQTLSLNKSWKRFIDFCRSKNALRMEA